MSSSNGTFPILNPNIYLNYLPHEIANQFEVSRNVLVATLGALLWDVLVSLPSEVRLVRSGIRLTISAYFLSRASSITYLLLGVIFKTSPIADCVAFEHAVAAVQIICVFSTTFLFLRRVHALYQDSRWIRHIFSFLWLIDFGLAFLVPFGAHEGPIADTGYCDNTRIERYVGGTTIATLVFDSSVFLAVSYKLAVTGFSESWSWQTAISGRALPRLSRALLQQGQQYYLLNVTALTLVSVLFLDSSVPPIYQATFTYPYIALASSMACRVYRNLRIILNVTEIQITNTSLRFRGPTAERIDTLNLGRRMVNVNLSSSNVTTVSIFTPSQAKSANSSPDVESGEGPSETSTRNEMA